MNDNGNHREIHHGARSLEDRPRSAGQADRARRVHQLFQAEAGLERKDYCSKGE
jgi:hypothetical protein